MAKSRQASSATLTVPDTAGKLSVVSGVSYYTALEEFPGNRPSAVSGIAGPFDIMASESGDSPHLIDYFWVCCANSLSFLHVCLLCQPVHNAANHVEH